MKILVTGANGQLGWELIRRADAVADEVMGTDHFQLDISDNIQVADMLADFQPHMVVNAAAYTAVDKAESEPDIAFAVNRDGVANLAESCAKQHIPLIHISTDFVFDGKKKTPYTETDPTAPIGIYGKSKAAGEKAVISHLKTHIILRTSWVYGIHGHNFVKTMLRLGRERDVIRVVADQYGCPTNAADLADAVLRIAAYLKKSSAETGLPIADCLPSHLWGIYHYCGQGITTWYGFAEKIFSIVSDLQGFKNLEGLRFLRVEPITTAEYPTPAKRPEFSALDCTRIQQNFGIAPKRWDESLAIMVNDIMMNG